jgi:hypothetical protein
LRLDAGVTCGGRVLFHPVTQEFSINESQILKSAVMAKAKGCRKA